MNDCPRVSALLDVYLDDETTPETNAMVQQHLALCGSCAARLASAREMRAALRGALRAERAPAGLHQRVRAVLPPPRPALAAFIRAWIVPAAATALVAWIVLPWPRAEPGIDHLLAVGEHVVCALEREVPHGVSYYAADMAMPWMPSAGGTVRVVEAHACSRQSDYLLHMVLEEHGSKLSILITRAPEGAARVVRAQRTGNFEVSSVRTTRHRAFVVIDRQRARALRDWREPAVQRVQHFLEQLEGL